MILVVIKGFVYTIAAYIYAFHLAFSSILHCVLHHFTSRFVPFYLAFCTFLPCVLHQNAVRFGAKRSAFSGILHHI